MTKPSYHYEIRFNVPGQLREKYEEWIKTEAFIDWITYKTVSGFEVYYNDQGMSPESKFVFRFNSLEDWATFIGSEIHNTMIKSLKTFTEMLEGQLWQQGSLRLNCNGGHRDCFVTEPL